MASEESAHLTAAKTSDYGSTNDYGGTETSEYGTANEYGSAVETGVSEYGSAGTGVPTDGAVGTGVSEYGSAAVSDYGSAKAAEASGVPDALVADAEVKPQENNNSTKLTASDEFLPYVASSGSSDSENDEKERKDKDKERKSRSGSPEHRKSGSRSSSRSSGSSRSHSPSPKKENAGVAVTSPIPVPDAPSSSSSSKPFAFGQSRGSRSRSRSRSGSTSRSRSDRRRRRRSPRRHRSRSHSPRRRRGTRRRRHHSRDRHRRRHRRRRSRSRSHGRSRSRERRKSRERRRSRSKERKRSRDRHRERPARHEEQHGKITYKEHLKQSLLNAQKEMEKTGKLDLNCDTNKELSQYLANRGEKPSKLPIYDDPVLAVTGGVELDDKVTPQMAFIHSMKEMHRKAQELTGVAVPKYYNPAAVNPMKYAEQVQKRKLLWSKAKDESTETKPAPTWQAAAKVLEKETDGKSSEKFKKLMGIKAPSQESDGKEEDEPETEAIQKKQNDLFNQLNKEYEFARMATHTHKGIGLGFTSHYQTFAQQAQQGKAPNPGTEPE